MQSHKTPEHLAAEMFMLRRIYDWTMPLAGTSHAEKALPEASFIEKYPCLIFTFFMLPLGSFHVIKVIL